MGVVMAVSKTFNPYSRGIDYAQEFSGGYFSLKEGVKRLDFFKICFEVLDQKKIVFHIDSGCSRRYVHNQPSLLLKQHPVYHP